MLLLNIYTKFDMAHPYHKILGIIFFYVHFDSQLPVYWVSVKIITVWFVDTILLFPSIEIFGRQNEWAHKLQFVHILYIRLIDT